MINNDTTHGMNDKFVDDLLEAVTLCQRAGMSNAEILSAINNLPSAAWKPVDDTTPDETWVEVIGNSGMTSPPHFLGLACRMTTYRPLDPWRDVQRCALSDNGWTPLFWRIPQPVPDVRTAPKHIPPGEYTGAIDVDTNGNITIILENGQRYNMGKLPE